MNGYSPPLSILSLCPPPLRQRTALNRPDSILSASSQFSSSTFHHPPPSSFNRRSRSVELSASINLLAGSGNPSPSDALTARLEDAVHAQAMSNMSTMTAVPSPPKKPGFFRRLSLSAQGQPVVQASPHSPRHVSGTARNGTIGGPSYDAMSATPAPSPFRAQDITACSPGGERTVKANEKARGNVAVRTTPSVSASPDGQWRSDLARNPIHPALASPPRTHQVASAASSPYDSVRLSPVDGGNQRRRAVPIVSEMKVPHGRVTEMPRMQAQSYPSSQKIPTAEHSPLTAYAPPPQTHRQHSIESPSGTRSPPRPHRISIATPSMPESSGPGRVRPIPPPLSIPLPASPTSSAPLPRSHSAISKFSDAADPVTTLPPGAQPSAFPSATPTAVYDRGGRISARRTVSASHAEPAPTANTESPASAEYRPSQVPTLSSSVQHQPQPGQMSEASAYARAIAATLSARSPKSSPAAASPMSSPSTPSGRRVSRPLPAPPSSGVAESPARSEASNIDNPSPLAQLAVRAAKRGPTGRQSHAQVEHRSANQTLNFDFPRSPTLPALIDPRQVEREHRSGRPDPIAQSTRSSKQHPADSQPQSLAPTQLPPRGSSSKAAFANDPMATRTENTLDTRPDHRRHPPVFPHRPHTSILYILALLPIQTALLPHLNINSFLSLVGASDLIRKRFTGEAVGRWVLSEWNIQLEQERGRTWPNLTVWEGFLESLLHDPATYSTYPPQWYSLLQHLSLSQTLVVLHLRQLPASAYPGPPPLPFDEDPTAVPISSLPFSASTSSFGSTQRPRSRLNSAAASEAGSVTSSSMPRQLNLVEIVMPEPLASQTDADSMSNSPGHSKPRRRGSIGSIASVASLPFGRRRTNSTSTEAFQTGTTTAGNAMAAPMVTGKASLPPVSYPTPKRYGFTRHGESARSRTSSDSGRPGSIFSIQSSPSMVRQRRMSSAMSSRASFAVDRQAPPVPGLPSKLGLPPPIGGGHRGSTSSSDAGGRNSRRSDYGGNSPINGSTFFRRDFDTPPARVEPAFEKSLPYTVGRAPVLRVFVPLSEKVPRWPSAEGSAAAVKELEKCGALRRLRLGDLVVNTALLQPESTQHMLIFVPHTSRLLISLDYSHSRTGHPPAGINGFTLPPSYYHPLLSDPQIVYLDLAPFAQRALQSIRLAYDRRDVTVASGARLSAKRYLHVAGFEIGPGDKVAPEWHGLVTLEAEGTAEGKRDMEKRLIGLAGRRPVVGAWEVIREKCMMGNIWLRLVKETAA